MSKKELKSAVYDLRLPFNVWTVGGISLLLIALSYALYLPKLGFYLDDWPQLYSLLVRGTEGIKQYFLYDGRPFGYWPDLFFFKLWGTNPILWHLTNYALRWIVGLLMWGTFTQLWPKHKREIFWVVLLFAVYPLFGQQSMGLTFIAHWCCYVLFFASLFLMVLAFRKPKYLIPLLIASVLIDIPNLFTYENFIGVEFLRPVMIWWLLEGNQPFKKRLRNTLLYWMPFLLMNGLYIFWRLALSSNLRLDTSPLMFTSLLAHPFTAIGQFVEYFLKDTFQVLFGVWFPTLSADRFDFASKAALAGLFIGVIVFGILFIGFGLHKKNEKTEENPAEDNFRIQAVWLGLLGVVLGCLPGWLIGRTVSDSYGLWNDRFGLAAMFGAGLFIVGALTVLFNLSYRKRDFIIIVLMGLAVGYNFTVVNDYRWSTIYQNRFFSQLAWRVPSVEPNTSFMADNEMFTKMGVYPTSFALNIFYPTTQPMPALDYWFFTLNKYFPDQAGDLASGFPVSQGHWYAKYEAQSQNSLVIAWKPGTPDCLWVLSTNDRYNPMISENTRLALAASDLSRINTIAPSPVVSIDLFGKQNQAMWCYFYETADLARQSGNWGKVLSIYEESVDKGYKPSNGIELMPFIEAYSRTGNPEKALELTRMAKDLSPKMRDFLCDNWNRIAKDLVSDSSFKSIYDNLYTEYSCSVIGK
jgi:hypothetical protein